ncbi:reverse transcriptase domain-containing protein [Tanacetum coccineum]
MKSQQSTNTFVKETFMDLNTQLKTVAKNHQASIQNLETKFDRLADKQPGRPSGSLPNFSKIARPLTKLLEKDTPFKFDDECRRAFESLKEKLTCAPVIVSPNWNLPFELLCDASDFAIGAVLADHLSRLENDETSDDSEVDDNFPGETLMEININEPWFADFVNYLVVVVDYVSKWAKAQALPTNDARVVVIFLKKLFCRFGMPKALISDRGTHFCKKIMEKTMKRYGVNHRFSTSYHPQTSGQVKNINRALKRILEKTVKDNPAIWSRKLDDALWAFRTTYKTPTSTTPYKLIYGKNCHLPFEIEHRAYWALKNCNPDLIAAGEKRMFQLHELDELRYQAYENSHPWYFSLMIWKITTYAPKIALPKLCTSLCPGKLKPYQMKYIPQVLVLASTPFNAMLLKYLNEEALCQALDTKEVVDRLGTRYPGTPPRGPKEAQIHHRDYRLFHQMDGSKAFSLDHGTQLVKDPFKSRCEKWKIKQMNTAVAHPQANGLVEKANKSLMHDLMARLGRERVGWVDELFNILWAHRTMLKTTNGETPFNLIYGSEALILTEIGMPTYQTIQWNEAQNEEEIRLNLDLIQERRETAAIREAKYNKKVEQYYNKRVFPVLFKVEDFVYRRNEASQVENQGKLGPNWEGPYRVVEAYENSSYKLCTMND